MNFSAFLQQVALQLEATSLTEWVAVAFGLLQVVLALKNNVFLYPAGIISTSFSIYLLANVALYAESLLNLYYLVMSIYGWVHWMQKKSTAELPITRMNKNQFYIVATIVIPGGLLLYFILKYYTNSDVPALDAFVSATAWAGMWLLARRKLENWILLNISNLVAIPLQFYKGIPLYALLTTLLFVIAIFGYFHWKKLMKLQPAL